MNNAYASANTAERDTKLNDLLDKASRLAVFAAEEAARTDDVQSFPAETMRRITDEGFLTAPLAEKFGGIGLGINAGTNETLLQILKNFGRGNLVVGRVFEGHFNALLLLSLYADAEQNARFAADAKAGKLFGVWNTEAADGVKIFTAGRDEILLQGAKTFATGVDYVSRPFVNAALPDGGWQMTIIPLDKISVETDASWWNPLGMKASRSYKVDFTGGKISRRNLIGEAGNYYAQPWFSGGAVRFAAVQLGGAEALFDETRQYLQKLGRTDDPYQKQRLGEMAILIETGNLWLNGAARKFDEYLLNPSPERCEKLLAYVNLTRTAIEEICLKTMNLCQKCVGARGLNQPFPMERIIRDLTIYLRQPAPDAALAEAGKYVLDSQAIADNLWK